MDDDIKQRRNCRCCNKKYDYAVPGSRATRFVCEDCFNIPESLRKVLISFNKRLVELETQIKTVLPKKRLEEKPQEKPQEKLEE